MAINGIDIASYQARLNTAAISGDFIIIKATQGTGYINPTWKSQIDAARAAGKKVGLYHYANGQGYMAEVNFFLQTVKDYIGKAVLALDWEHIPTYGPNASFYNPKYAKNFMDEVKKRTGVSMIIYMSKDSSANAMDWSDVAKDYRLWGAQYANNNIVNGYQANPWQSSRKWGAWGSLPTIHQYTSNLRLAGWNAGLDGNIAYLNKEEWDALAGTKAETVTTVKPTKAKELDKANLLQYVVDVRAGKYGNGETRKAKLGDYYKQVQDFIDYIEKASVDTLAAEVLTGKYGNEPIREKVLGAKYARVQAAVNKKLKKQKDITTLAKEVIKGKWGDGTDRVNRLRAAGYDSTAVQKEVNRLLA